MAFSINAFLSSMTEDGYRPNLFEVQFNFPTNLAISADIARNISFKAKSTSIPSSDIGVASVYFYGREVKFAGNREFGSWQMTLIMDEPDFNKSTGVRGIFELWSSYINSHYTNIRNESYKTPNSGSGYFGNAKIIPLSKIGTSVSTSATDLGTVGATPGYAGIALESYQMIGCYPIDVGEISIDWQDNNRIAEFTVTFDYQYWTNAAEVLAV